MGVKDDIHKEKFSIVPYYFETHVSSHRPLIATNSPCRLVRIGHGVKRPDKQCAVWSQ